MSIFPKQKRNFVFFPEAKWAKKKWKMAEKMKISGGNWRKNCEKMFSVYEWYLLFCVIQRREITKNEEKRVFVWVVWSIILKIVSYNPKTECCHYMQISKKNKCGKKQQICFYEWNRTSFSEKTPFL